MQDQEQEVKTYAQMLQEGLDEVFSSDPYRRFLRFVSNNPTYSYRNVLLILHQRPNATKVMGYKAWLKQGRCVQQGQRGLRVIAKFDKNDEDDRPLPVQAKRKKASWKEDAKYRRISVFDISQTVPLDDEEPVREEAENFSVSANALELFNPSLLEGKVNNYSMAIRILQTLSPLPLQFCADTRLDGSYSETAIRVKAGMSQLHTIRTIINQIVQVWRREACPDQEQAEIEAESVAYIVCQYLGLDTSDFSFSHIARYSFSRERKALELFLDGIQKTAMYFIDTIEGILEAEKRCYDESEFFLISQKRAQRLLATGYSVYLVFPGEGELFTCDRKAIEKHEGLFATDRAVWFSSACRAA